MFCAQKMRKFTEVILPSTFSLIKNIFSFIHTKKIMPRLPFNWRTPTNYIYCQLIWVVLLQVVVFIYCGSITLYMGICRYLVIFCEDLKQTVRELNEEIVHMSRSQKTLTAEERVKLKSLFNALIHFHADMIQLSITNFLKQIVLPKIPGKLGN